MLEKILVAGSLPLVLVGLLSAGLGVPIPEDPLLLAAGVISHRTRYGWWLALPLVYVSAIGADCGLFLFARRFGETLLSRRPFCWLISEPRRARVRALFERYGSRAVFFGRHLSGLRAVVFILAGIEQMSLGRFLLWDGLAGLITIPVMFGLGYLFSSHVAVVQAGIARVEHWIFAGVGAAVVVTWFVWSHRLASHSRASRDESNEQER